MGSYTVYHLWLTIFTSDSILKLHLPHGVWWHNFLLGMTNSPLSMHAPFFYLWIGTELFLPLTTAWTHGCGTSFLLCFSGFVPSSRVIGWCGGIIFKYLRDHYSFHTRYTILVSYQKCTKVTSSLTGTGPPINSHSGRVRHVSLLFHLHFPYVCYTEHFSLVFIGYLHIFSRKYI